MNQKIGYIPGVFDLFHHGHKILIEKSLDNCDKLIIGIHTDDFTEYYKRLPDQPQEIRKQNIVNYITEFNLNKIIAVELVDNIHIEIVQKYNVNIIFHGDDWELESYKKQIRYIEDGLDKLNVEIMILKYTIGISSTLIKNFNKSNISHITFNKITEVCFDLDNTLMLNNKATHKAVECIEYLQSKNINITVITNNNRYKPKQISDSLKKNGICLEENQIQSSLRQLLQFLQNNTTYKNVYVWGGTNAIEFLNENDIQLENIIYNSDLVVFLYNNNFNYDTLTSILTHITTNNVPYIIGNIDLLYPDSKKILPDTGLIYKIIQLTLPCKNQTPLMILGKPTADIYTPINTNNCIMIGDNIKTDGEYAKKINIPFFYLTNNAKQEDNAEQEDNVNYKISNLGVIIDYFTYF